MEGLTGQGSVGGAGEEDEGAGEEGEGDHRCRWKWGPPLPPAAPRDEDADLDGIGRREGDEGVVKEGWRGMEKG